MSHIANYADHIFVFSDFWKKHLVKGFGISHEKISVFPHGIDTQKFSKIDKKAAKVSIGLRPNDFVVFNNNRNSYRKLWDVTIKAFVRFWKLTGCKSNVKLLINCRMDIQDGYNFHDIIYAACINECVDIEKISNNNIILLSSTSGGIVSDSVINAAYNASNIGLNTCGGEGFGLCNAEAGFLGVPQIVTRTGGLADIFGKFENMLVDPKVYMSLTTGIDFHNGELAICDYKDFADKMYFYYNYQDIMEIDGKNLEQHMKTTYDWNRLLEQFLRDLERVMS
jgi:glycosyltransferase involved in cell wall biosynthesis